MIQEASDSAPPSRSLPVTMKAECGCCGGIRNCDIHGEHTEIYNDGVLFEAWKTWRILKCRGCGYVFIQMAASNSEDYDQEYDVDGSTNITLNETFEYWPALSKRKMPDWMENGIEAKNAAPLKHSMRELYGALENDLNRLAAIGMRMSFDIATERLGVGPERSFKEKLNELVSKGFIGIVDKERLEVLVDAGSASAHRGWSPTMEDLRSMMDILEHFVETAFVEPFRRRALDAKAAKVKTGVPKRKTRVKKPAAFTVTHQSYASEK
jgi:hypothetical protein